MSSTELIILGLVMLTGFIGIVVPVVPGLVLMVAAALWWAIADGGGWGHWFVFGLITVLAAAGTALKYLVPAKTSVDAGTTTQTLVLAFGLAIVLFFVIPVIGAPIGFVLGVYAGEWWRLRSTKEAWTATKAALKGVALGALIEGAAAVLILGTWLIGVQANGGDFGLF